MLQAGFSRLDITPVLGTSLRGYYEERLADGVLDPLLASAVAFDNGEERAVIMSLDLIGIGQPLMDDLRQAVADRLALPKEAVYIACTHTHLAPHTILDDGTIKEPEYIAFLQQRLCDTAELAMKDLAPTEMSYTRGRVEGVAFICRYRMKDGGVKTNPGYQNPDIVAPIGEADEQSQLLVLKREGKPEIGIVNFQVHPDVIGGCKVSADYPKFVRDTYEKLIENSYCIFFNGAQGDTNHCDFSRPKGDRTGGYERARYMGEKIAYSVIGNYYLRKPLAGDRIRYGQKNLYTLHNKGEAHQQEEALRIYEIYKKEGGKVAKVAADEKGIVKMVEAVRIGNLQGFGEGRDLPVTALAIGEAVFVGFPGEPFTEIGRQVKQNSDFTLTIPTCCSNGYADYFPMRECFDEGGYEATAAIFVGGTAERLIEGAGALIHSLWE